MRANRRPITLQEEEGKGKRVKHTHTHKKKKILLNIHNTLLRARKKKQPFRATRLVAVRQQRKCRSFTITHPLFMHALHASKSYDVRKPVLVAFFFPPFRRPVLLLYYHATTGVTNARRKRTSCFLFLSDRDKNFAPRTEKRGQQVCLMIATIKSPSSLQPSLFLRKSTFGPGAKTACLSLLFHSWKIKVMNLRERQKQKVRGKKKWMDGETPEERKFVLEGRKEERPVNHFSLLV